MDWHVSTVPDSIDVDVNGVLRLNRQAQLGSGLSLRERVVTGVVLLWSEGPTSVFLSGADGYIDFPGDVAVTVASPAVLAGDIAVGVASPAISGAASLADLAGDVAVGVASPVVVGAASLANFAGGVTVGVASLTIDGVGSPAVAGMASLADIAWGVTVGAASLADAGVASLADAGVASLADAGVASLADLAGSVAGGVTDLAEPVCVGTDEMTLPQDCGVQGCSVFGDSVYCDGEEPNAWCQEMPEV